MKIVGTAGDDLLAQISQDEIAVLLGFRSRYDDTYKHWLEPRRVYGDGGRPNLYGVEIAVVALGSFWNTVLHKENEAKQAAKTLHALADLITTNLPSGMFMPVEPVEEKAKP